MNKNLVYIVVIFLIIGFSGCNSNDSVDNFQLEILHLNDTHSHLEPIQISIYPNGEKTYVYTGGYAKIAQFLQDKQANNSHTLTLHAGDAVQGTLYYTLFNGEADVKTLNEMSLDAMTIGNHEFDRGADDFALYFANEANFDIVSSDINASKNEKLKNIIKPYTIKDIDGENIAIVGDTIDSSVISNPGPTIEFANYLTSAQNSVEELKNQNINKIIFLTHIGFGNDKILANSVSDIDIIVGGHSHTLIGNFSNLGLTSAGEYPTVIEHNSSKTLVVTSYKWGEVVGDLSVIFDKNGFITNYSGTPVMLVDDKFLRKDQDGNKVEVNATTKVQLDELFNSMENIKVQEANSMIQEIIDTYKPKVDELMNTSIGTANTDLLNVRLPGSTDPETGIVLEHGSMIAPHVALSMYEKAKEIGGCDLALQNAGAVRISIYQGDITIGLAYTLLPFGNTLVTLELDGVTIKTMLENAIDRSLITQKNTGAFPYLAGAKITINQNNDKGYRIVEFKIKDSNDDWVNFDTSKIYKIATNSYIANGGDYYTTLKENAINKVDTGYIIAENFVEYVKRKKILDEITLDELPVNLVE